MSRLAGKEEEEKEGERRMCGFYSVDRGTDSRRRRRRRNSIRSRGSRRIFGRSEEMNHKSFWALEAHHYPLITP